MRVKIKKELENFGCKVFAEQSMALHTTFKIGGKVALLCLCNNRRTAEKAYLYLYENDIPFFVVGAGSNLLVSDKGFSGVILKFFGDNYIADKGNGIIEASGGTSGASVVNKALLSGYTGGEFMATIPGSLGGQVRMNAGCYGKEIKDLVLFCDCILDGERLNLSQPQCKFGYRTGIFAQKKGIVLKVGLKFREGCREEGLNELKRIRMLRKESQPNKPNAGSIFKRKDGIIPARLIDQAGLKGFSCGNAAVSEKHSGFIVNNGGASAEDVYTLIQRVKNIIYRKYTVMLEEEIVYIGEF